MLLLLRHLLPLAGLSVLPSCFLVRVSPLESVAAPGGYPSPSRPELLEYRAAFHCHSFLSHDSEGTVEEIASAAKRTGMNAVFLHDHYAPEGVARSPSGLRNEVLFVPGLELNLPPDASLLVSCPARDFAPDRGLADLRDEFLRDGALLTAGHVEGLAPDWRPAGHETFEIDNVHARFLLASPGEIILAALLYPRPAFFESLVGSAPRRQLRRWDEALRHGRVAPVAGHDAHANIRLLGPLGWTIGDYDEIFRLFSVRILARELTVEALLDGLRRGRCFVSYDFLGDARGFCLAYVDPRGDTQAILGEEAPWTPRGRLEARAPRPVRWRLLRDGRLIGVHEGERLDVRLPGPGTYRVELWLDGSLWVVPAPIWITDPEEE